LSAEVLKTLKSFVTDEAVNAVVITVPAAFKNNQIDATRRAAKLAGFEHAEVLQEPVAAAMAYGLDNKKKDGFWLVFDFGGGTFDAALLKVEDGIMKVPTLKEIII
jgi:molecular chaperone DnaK